MNSVSITAPLRETGTPPKGRSRRSSRRRPQQPYVRLEVLSANEVARRDSAGAACPPQARQRVTLARDELHPSAHSGGRTK